ncbi:hypothetical protein Ahy_B10g106380 [Arachis hypogaea]|uniref:Uncharacterized protein n=1 Tax=Arachis hypogaea TaxID=3818 RepID=A0A444XAM6_ARAHY|nr:hypothetical protein Ahy_B10g106380 [Arachis hypogaea]
MYGKGNNIHLFNFISTFLPANSFRLNFVPIAPDFIFNCGGLSVAFVFVTNWDCDNVSLIFSRVQKLRTQFALYKQQKIGEKLKAEKQSVQGMNFYLKMVTSIPGIDNHEANVLELFCHSGSSIHLSQAIGSVQAIAKASKDQILENTDLSAEKAEMISRFQRDPKLYSSPKIT